MPNQPAMPDTQISQQVASTKKHTTKMPMQTNSSSAPASPHVLIFPLPLQGTVNSMLKLAEILCISDINVTFVVTDHIHSRLLRNSNVVSRFSKYPGFVLQSISDGLPKEHPRGGSRYIEMFESMKLNSKPLLKELLNSGWLDRGRGPVTCIIADGVMSFVCDVANDIGVNIFCTRTLSACSLSIFFSLPKLIDAGELPFTGMSYFSVFLFLTREHINENSFGLPFLKPKMYWSISFYLLPLAYQDHIVF